MQWLAIQETSRIYSNWKQLQAVTETAPRSKLFTQEHYASQNDEREKQYAELHLALQRFSIWMQFLAWIFNLKRFLLFHAIGAAI